MDNFGGSDFSFLYLTPRKLKQAIYRFNHEDIDSLITQTFKQLSTRLSLDNQQYNYFYLGIDEIISELVINHRLNTLAIELAVGDR